MKLFHNDPYPNERGRYECEKCGEKFRLQSTLDRHKCSEEVSLFN